MEKNDIKAKDLLDAAEQEVQIKEQKAVIGYLEKRLIEIRRAKKVLVKLEKQHKEFLQLDISEAYEICRRSS